MMILVCVDMELLMFSRHEDGAFCDVSWWGPLPREVATWYKAVAWSAHPTLDIILAIFIMPSLRSSAESMLDLAKRVESVSFPGSKATHQKSRKLLFFFNLCLRLSHLCLHCLTMQQ